ncbi:hypothetical protein MCEMSEM23_00138 [Rhabdaerophilaceae bacterium]
MAQLFTFVRNPAFESADWTNREISELYRVEAALCAARLSPQTERGITDEGDPWFVFCRSDGEPIVHITRSGGLYRLFSPVLSAPIVGASFEDITRQFISEMPVKLSTSARVVIHPSALFSVLIGTLFFLLDGLDSPEAAAAEALGSATANLPPAVNDPESIGALLAAGLVGKAGPICDLHGLENKEMDGVSAFERYVSLVGALVVVASSAEIASFLARAESVQVSTDLDSTLVLAGINAKIAATTVELDDSLAVTMLRRVGLSSQARRDDPQRSMHESEPETTEALEGVEFPSPDLPAPDLQNVRNFSDLVQIVNSDWSLRSFDQSQRNDEVADRSVFVQGEAPRAAIAREVQSKSEGTRDQSLGHSTQAIDSLIGTDNASEAELDNVGASSFAQSNTLIVALGDVTARAIAGQLSAASIAQQMAAIAGVWENELLDAVPIFVPTVLVPSVHIGGNGTTAGLADPVDVSRKIRIDAISAPESDGSVIASQNGTLFLNAGTTLDLNLATDFARSMTADLFTLDSFSDLQDFFANADSGIERIVDDVAIVLIDRGFVNDPRGYIDVRKFGLEGGMTITLIGYFDVAAAQIGLMA